jgi:acrylyl-CoA reductase (NADPH) / 3-hydroxypropionyl-CoA dehydratase / 3-hydroxypropionyl-CoA synthetase
MLSASASVSQHRLATLRLGTFCAEPVNEAVHRFAVTHLTPNYINSYWATEHGGIVWSRCHGNEDQPLLPDTRTWPLPWIDGNVLVPTRTACDDTIDGWRKAAPGEQGEVVIRRPYPYLALTVWTSEGFGTPEWRGDLARWSRYFVDGAGYVQGDAAVRHADGAYTFHGRSDEVMNVGGNRIGTEEIENAILLDRSRVGSPLLNCAVVGMADTVLGVAPCAFLVLQPGAVLSAADEGRIRSTVQSRVSSVAVPSRFLVVPALPETYSGKYMRRLLHALLAGEPLGDVAALRNPECVSDLRAAVSAQREIAADRDAPSLEDKLWEHFTQILRHLRN